MGYQSLSGLILLFSTASCMKMFYSGQAHRPETPVCTSHSSVCHVNFRYVDDEGRPLEMMDSETPMCTCMEGDHCPVTWDNRNNSIVKKLCSGGNQDMEMKVSYCHVTEPTNPCGFNEPVLMTRGRGPVLFELASDLLCNCRRPFVAHASWTEGDYDYFQYSCGKPRCSRLATDDCAVLTFNTTDLTLRHEFHCRCRRNEVCTGVIPSGTQLVAEHRCTSTGDNRRDNLTF